MSGWRSGLAVPALFWVACSAAFPASAAEPVAIAFSPPAGPLLYESVSERTVRGHAIRHLVRRELRFSREGEGWRVTSRILTQSYEGPAGLVRLLEVEGRALEGHDIAFRIAADGSALAPSRAEADWALIAGGLDHMLAADDPAMPPMAKMARRMMAERMRALSAEERQAILLNEVRPVLDYAGRRMIAGQSGVESVAANGAGQIRLVETVRTSGAEGSGVRQVTATIAQDSGLVESAEITIGTDDGLEERQVRMRIRRIALDGV